MHGAVKIIPRKGGRYAVQLDPRHPPMRRFTVCQDFSEAAGCAAGLALGMGRTIVDETGRLSKAECRALVSALALDGIKYVLNRLVRGLPIQES